MGQPIKQFYHWYMSKPIITKLYFAMSLLLFTLMYLNILTIQSIYVNYDTLSNLQLWRLLTALVYQNSNSLISYPVKFYISYSIIVNFEERLYSRTSYKQYAEFLWLVIIVLVVVNTITIMFNYYITNHFFFMCLCFIWAKKTPNSHLNLTLNINLPIYYLPYLYSLYYWVVGMIGFWTQLIVAFALGYLYYYLKIYSITHYGKDYLTTPKVFQLLIEKYLLLEQKLRIYQPLRLQEEQDDDPYSQYGYYTHSNRYNQQKQQNQQEQEQNN